MKPTEKYLKSVKRLRNTKGYKLGHEEGLREGKAFGILETQNIIKRTLGID